MTRALQILGDAAEEAEETMKEQLDVAVGAMTGVGVAVLGVEAVDVATEEITLRTTLRVKKSESMAATNRPCPSKNRSSLRHRR